MGTTKWKRGQARSKRISKGQGQEGEESRQAGRDQLRRDWVRGWWDEHGNERVWLSSANYGNWQTKQRKCVVCDTMYRHQTDIQLYSHHSENLSKIDRRMH